MLSETGQLPKLFEKWDTMPKRQCDSLETKPLGLENTVSSFALLVLTMLVSLLILSIEKLTNISAGNGRNRNPKNILYDSITHK